MKTINFRLRTYSIVVLFFYFCNSLPVNATPILSLSSTIPNVPTTRLDLPTNNREYISYRIGYENFSKGDLDRAEKNYQLAIEENPHFFPAMIGLADIAFVRNKPKVAKTYLQKALTISPHSSIVQTAWGRYLFQSKQYKKAAQHFKKAIEAKPDLPEPHIELAALYLMHLNKPKLAIEQYTKVIKLQPDNLELLYGLSAAQSSLGMVSAAAETLDKAIEKAPYNAQPWQIKGNLYSGVHQFDEAILAFNKALELEPKLASAYWARGQAHIAVNNFRKAINDFETITKLNENAVAAWVKIGVINQLNNNYVAAKIAYFKVLEKDTKIPLVYNNLAYGAITNDINLDQAIEWANKAVKLAPQNSDYVDTLGWALQKNGELKAAKKNLEKSVKLNKNNAEALFHLGVVNLKLGNIKKANLDLRNALQISDQFIGANEAKQLLKDITN